MEAHTFQHLNEVSASLVRTPGKPGDLKSVLQHIAETAEEAFGTDICVILAFNPITAKFLGSRVAVGDLRVTDQCFHDKPESKGLTQVVMQNGEVFIEDLEDK